MLSGRVRLDMGRPQCSRIDCRTTGKWTDLRFKVYNRINLPWLTGCGGKKEMMTWLPDFQFGQLSMSFTVVRYTREGDFGCDGGWGVYMFYWFFLWRTLIKATNTRKQTSARIAEIADLDFPVSSDATLHYQKQYKITMYEMFKEIKHGMTKMSKQ